MAIAAALPSVPTPLRTERLTGVALTMVAGCDHPLATYEGTIPKAELARHVQLVLTDRSAVSAGVDFSVMSPSVWRLTDLFAKHTFLLDGLGWGGMPVHAVARDIAEGLLVELRIEDLPSGAIVVPMAAAYPTASPPGPAGRWLIKRLKASAEAGTGPPTP